MRLLGSALRRVAQCCSAAAGLCILRVAISGSSALLVLMLQRVRVLLGSHAESGPLAGGGTEDTKTHKAILCIQVEIRGCRLCVVCCSHMTI